MRKVSKIDKMQVDREKVLKHGKEISGKLLVELQVRKSTADGAGANSFYNILTEPMAGWIPELRDFVIEKKTVGCSMMNWLLF